MAMTCQSAFRDMNADALGDWVLVEHLLIS